MSYRRHALLLLLSMLGRRSGAFSHARCFSPLAPLRSRANGGISLATRRSSPRTCAAGRGSAADSSASSPDTLPRELMPITLAVFAQTLGEGIALSSLPMHLTRLGASPLSVGLGISCFSVAQMTFAPILVGLSNRIGRSLVLRICLAGAAASSLLIAACGSVAGIIAGRALAGVFAACVPVAQSGVTDILTGNQTALGLSRVSAASQLGVVVGPAASALLQERFAVMGIPAALCLPAVFVAAAVFSLGVLVQMAFIDQQRHPPVSAQADSEQPVAAKEEEPAQVGLAGRVAQPVLRTITIVVGWTAILSNSIYGLFAPRFLGFQQPQLSATYSGAAIMMVATQVVFPRLVAKLGAHRACTIGILAAGTGIGGLSLVLVQPWHSALYMLNRMGAAVADTSAATLVACSSHSKEARSRNLALLTSTRAAARVLTPILSGKMFEWSCAGFRYPGALPFVTAACFAMAVAPLPMLLLRAEERAM